MRRRGTPSLRWAFVDACEYCGPSSALSVRFCTPVLSESSFANHLGVSKHPAEVIAARRALAYARREFRIQDRGIDGPAVYAQEQVGSE